MRHGIQGEAAGMFMNGDAIVTMLKVMAILLAMGVFLVFAHGIWIARLARAPDLLVRSTAGRIPLVCLAALMPLVSYYIVGTARRFASARHDGPWHLVTIVPLALFVVLGIAVAIGAALAGRLSTTNPGIVQAVSVGLIWIGLWILVLYMIVRVFSSATLPRSIVVTLSLMVKTIGFLAIPFE